jgi:hypothetical protein
MTVVATVCMAAGTVCVVNAAEWRSSEEKARAVLSEPRSTVEQRRDALYVLRRYEELDATLYLAEAAREDLAGEHARNHLEVIRKAWGAGK